MTSRQAPTGPLSVPASQLPAGARRSHALESLTSHLRSSEGLQVLDFGGINQANLDFVTGLGHRLYSEDLIRAYDMFFRAEEISARRFEAGRLEEFLDQTFEFDDQSCDGALVWDSLQFLPPVIAQAVLGRMHRVLAPDAFVMAFFQPDSAGAFSSPHRCRILDPGHLQLTPRPMRRPIEAFNTRSIERFFQRFRAVKFFLTRENLQEVVAKR